MNPWKPISPTKSLPRSNSTTIAPDQRDVHGFAAFMERYKEGLAIERTAVDALK